MANKKKKPKQVRRPDVPDDHNVARHCHHQRIIRDLESGDITGVFPQEFELRLTKKETYLSMNWLEFFPGNLDAQFKAVVAALRAKRKVVGRSAIARIRAGSLVESGKIGGYTIRVRDKSSAKNPGYVGIEGVNAGEI